MTAFIIDIIKVCIEGRTKNCKRYNGDEQKIIQETNIPWNLSY